MIKKAKNCDHKWDGTHFYYNPKSKMSKQKQLDKHHKNDKCKRCGVKLFEYIFYVQKLLNIDKVDKDIEITDNRIAPGT